MQSIFLPAMTVAFAASPVAGQNVGARKESRVRETFRMAVLIGGASRLVTFALPALWLSRQPNFTMQQVWWLAVATVTLQALFRVWLLMREFRKRTGSVTARAAVVA